LFVIGNIEDFADAGRLAAHFGIVPRVHQSAQTLHSGRITKEKWLFADFTNFFLVKSEIQSFHALEWKFIIGGASLCKRIGGCRQ
jgi:hypothetical protein